MTTNQDICYGPLAADQFFIDRLNPQSPIIYRIGAAYRGVDNLFICETWGMNEKGNVWSFGKKEYGCGIQIATCNLERMERVSAHTAHMFAEQELRHRDDEWRKQWKPDREPIKIVRCTCGLSDSEPSVRHAVGCFYRECR